MVLLHILWSVDSTKDISRQSQFLLNFNLWQFYQHTLSSVDPRDCRACQCFRAQILVSSGTFLMSLALLMTSCYMKNFGRCMVFSFQLLCIAEEDTILSKCSWQQCVWSLCEKGFLAPGLFFCIFFLLPPCVCALLMGDGPGSHLWWHYWRSKKHCGSPRGKQEKGVVVQEPGESKRKELWSNSLHY